MIFNYTIIKEIFKIFNKNDHTCSTNPKLVLYVAPTTTGKTMSPLGLSVNHRVIFVCAFMKTCWASISKIRIKYFKESCFCFWL